MPASRQQIARLEAVAKPALAASDNDIALARIKLAQWIYESGWGAFSVVARSADGLVTGYNPFGIKAGAAEEPATEVETTEELTPAQLDSFRARGGRVRSVGPLRGDGKYTVVIIDRFRVWPTVEAAFRGHTEFLQTGYRAAAWRRYVEGRRPLVAFDLASQVERDVKRLAYELQHLAMDEASGQWLRYSTSNTYDKDIADMAMSAAVSAVLSKAGARER